MYRSFRTISDVIWPICENTNLLEINRNGNTYIIYRYFDDKIAETVLNDGKYVLRVEKSNVLIKWITMHFNASESSSASCLL